MSDYVNMPNLGNIEAVADTATAGGNIFQPLSDDVAHVNRSATLDALRNSRSGEFSQGFHASRNGMTSAVVG